MNMCKPQKRLTAAFIPTRKTLTIDDAWRLIQLLPPDDRNTWVKVGGIFKDEFGSAGFAMWDEWSQGSDKYRARDAQAVWQSLGRNEKRAGIGSLVYLARLHGWNLDARIPARAPAPRVAPVIEHDTSAYASRLWLAGRFDDGFVGSHPYAMDKGITWAAGARRGAADGRLIGRKADCIIVPIRTDGIGKVQGVQVINPDGVKQTFGRVSGGCLALGHTINRNIPWYVAEGWASAVSVVFHHNRGNAVCAVAFGKHNLMQTAENLARAFEPTEIVVLREQDA